MYNRKGELCSRSKGTFALFTPGAAIKMGIMNKEDVKDFEQIFNAVKRGL